MLYLILAVLALYVLHLLLPPYMWMFDGQASFEQRKAEALGPRDQPRRFSVPAERARRAAANLQENLVLFLPLAILTIVVPSQQALALAGAAIFLIARILYLPAYVLAWAPWRSVVWAAGFLGCGLVGLALLIG